MKKIGLILLVFIFSSIKTAHATDSFYTQMNAQSNKIAGWFKDAKRSCSAEHFDLAICKRVCGHLKEDSDMPKACDVLKNPPQTNLAVVVPTVKKNIIIDLLQQKKIEWKEKRAELLDKLKAEKEELKNKFKEKFTEERCAKIQARIENRNGFFKGNYEKHTSVYVNLVDRVNKFITKADAVKLDTATIKSHLAVLQDKIEKFKDDYAAYKAKFDETKNYTCGHSEGEFKGALLESKELLKTVHADAADIRKYVRETILVDMKALKAQMPKSEEDNN
jgi:hypothetical protein